MSEQLPQLRSVRALLCDMPSALLGFSGGVDSSVLAVLLRQELGKDRMLAVIGRSASYPDAQWETARGVAARFDIPVHEIETHELDDAEYLANPTNRCFFCKRELWSRLGAEAAARGLAVVCDGTIADDLREHRPGRAAGLAAGVRSPLAEAGLTKTDVRAVARTLGLEIWDQPASPCLSSRVAYGVPITRGRLGQVESAEAYLRSLGITGDLRVRHDGAAARIEVERAAIPWLEARESDIRERLLRLGFTAVAIDPRGYRRGGLLADLRGQG